MSLLSKEQIRGLIQENNITSVQDLQTTLKNMFKDVLQEMLEAELEQDLGYSKYDVQSKKTENARNGYSKKTLRSNLGELEFSIPRDRNGDFTPAIVPKHKRDVSGIEEKVISIRGKGTL